MPPGASCPWAKPLHAVPASPETVSSLQQQHTAENLGSTAGVLSRRGSGRYSALKNVKVLTLAAAVMLPEVGGVVRVWAD